MYKIKQIPEDFIVTELNDIKTSKQGSYSYFILRKRDYATPVAVEKIAAFLGIPVKRIGFAGAKDRKALTTQWVSIEGKPEQQLNSFQDPDLQLEYKGRGDTPVYLGRLNGNKFEITIRNIKEKPKKLAHFINYFGEQRFSMNNVEIGRALVKKDFKRAVEIMMSSNGYYERIVREEYERTKDAIASLKKIPLHTLIFFVHAYQSEMWNQTAEELKNSKKNMDVPIIGFATEIKNAKIKKITDKILEKEGIVPRDFLIRSYPELSSEGGTRKLFAEVKNLKIGKLENDELNKEMKKVKLTFSLGKGSYATMLIKNLFE